MSDTPKLIYGLVCTIIFSLLQEDMMRRAVNVTRPCQCMHIKSRCTDPQQKSLSNLSSLQCFKSKGRDRINVSPIIYNKHRHDFSDFTFEPHENNQQKSYTKIILTGFIVGSGTLLWDQQKVNAAEKDLNMEEKKSLWLLKACKDNDLQAIHKLIKDGVSGL